MKKLLAIMAILMFSGVAFAEDSSFILPDHFCGDLVATFAFGIIAIVLIVLGYKIFDWLTPKCDYEEEISKGNLSAGITVAVVIIGLCYVVASVISAVIG